MVIFTQVICGKTKNTEGSKQIYYSGSIFFSVTPFSNGGQKQNYCSKNRIYFADFLSDMSGKGM